LSCNEQVKGGAGIANRINQDMLNETRQKGVVGEDCLSPDFLLRKKWSSSTAAFLPGFVMFDSISNSSIVLVSGTRLNSNVTALS
jgi:hypothetical protein